MTTTLELAGRSRMTTDVARPNMPILIQVPSLTAPGRRRPGPARRRRRLRKEVRFAGLTMMSVLPAGLLLLALGGAHPVERPVRASTAGLFELASATPAPATAEALPVASEAIPRAEAPATPAADPVVFHDYLLPVDGPEEPDHAGR